MSNSKKWFLLGTFCVLAVLISAGVYRIVSRRAIYQRVALLLPAEIKAAKAEGLPLEPQDLRRNPPIPPEQNAAPDYVKIHALLSNRSAAEKNIAADFLSKPSPDFPGIREALKRNAMVFALAEHAATLPHCDFNRKYELGPNLVLPELASLRALARELAAKALWENAAGHPQEALRIVTLGFRLSQHLREEPIMIAMLVSIATEAIMDSAFRKIVLSHQDDPAIIPLARKCLQSVGPLPDVEFALRGEVTMCRVCMDIVRKQPGQLFDTFPDSNQSLFLFGAITGDRADAWEYHCIAYWRQIFAGLRIHRGDLARQYELQKGIGDETEKHEHEPTFELSGILMPIFATAIRKIQHTEALRRLESTLVQLVEFKQQTGSFPTALTELNPSPATDPFTGKPLVYRRKGKGFVLYSVGEDGIDDGGTMIPKTKDGPKPDIVIDSGG